MKQNCGRHLRHEFQIHREGMALVSANFAAIGVVGEPLLGIFLHDRIKQFLGNSDAVLIHQLNELLHFCPAVGIELQANYLRFVTEDQTQKLAEFC